LGLDFVLWIVSFDFLFLSGEWFLGFGFGSCFWWLLLVLSAFLGFWMRSEDCFLGD
jgi:hypothetical protein